MAHVVKVADVPNVNVILTALGTSVISVSKTIPQLATVAIANRGKILNFFCCRLYFEAGKGQAGLIRLNQTCFVLH